jgi:hypothetical protein
MINMHSHQQNIAAISAEFHTHRQYNDFYNTFGNFIDGFIGNYEVCIAMANALSEWEIDNGGLDAYENAGLIWIEVVEKYVDTLIAHALEKGELPNAPFILRGVIAAAGALP